MTTRKSMEKALRAEGWRPLLGVNDFWREPRYAKLAYETADAFRIAMRRKAARESRRLKAAGAEYALWLVDFGSARRVWCLGFRFLGYTRAEALASLTQEGGDK